ncbi:unnamed protein product [Nezara viridula]|uniref:Major facilitator superfamily (MFS) profile domain-containing protein n=1 Tax=Nezara viridula TaxID=85310 RepID=A0A9P0MGX1_NEZVI|nr:unnamed protein product [Nezara viridula]
MVKINYKLFPVKAHYFFFLGALGPIQPFLPIFGKHLGVSEVVIGTINASIPVLFFALKPIFGFVLDYFQEKRKVVYMSLLSLMTVSFALMIFIPESKDIVHTDVNCTDINICEKSVYQLWNAQLVCGNVTHEIFSDDDTLCVSNRPSLNCSNNEPCIATYAKMKSGFYTGMTFWSFVITISIGSVFCNICNSLADAICFEVLGEGNEMKYGQQRVWGTIGFGLLCLIGGFFMNNVDNTVLYSIKDFYPAMYLCCFFMVIDLFFCYKLKLPPMVKSENIVLDVWNLVKQPHIATFLGFAVLAGMGDSAIIFYLLWYLEDLAKEMGQLENMKLLQGLTVAAETLIGEVVSFYLSGKILRKLGYGHCLSLCFVFYAIRFALIAMIPSPWWILPIELLMQGPTYALCYTTIVAYASAISPPGTTATVQGIAAGMDDAFGFVVGNLLWSALYKWYGGKVVFMSAAGLALASSIVHCCLYTTFFRNTVQIKKKDKTKVYEPANTEEIIESGEKITTELK